MILGVKVQATPVADINLLAKDVHVVGWSIVAIVALALYGILNTRFDNLKSLYFIMPQQVLLYISAWSSLHAVLQGQYADGAARPPIFILADQLPTIVVAVWHSVAIIDTFMRRSDD